MWKQSSRVAVVARSRALLPRRAGAETEPEWKLYEEGDPNLFDNWKGKAPGALAEQVDIDPNDWHAMTPDYDTSVSIQHALISLGTAFGVLAGFYYFCKAIAPEPALIPRNDWRTVPPSIVNDQPGTPYTPRPQ
ncbi:uncharacterized protein ACA1_272220 [Acanthamoeba castellanii str. Neff]|uniref:Uncharacterized protein n=1 Tax=Acanthamoeba castellanii (strain ATCC 30010 / Neff) TaxID=1257118 RepID=L8HG40_ACACF|nr:uncharacterized protein ACA1_272220 [Acanthamoeba castellanii str. Neff]ELR24222.1 hypothetical protein ACA1_272220 [Acanthamoeba castellanii str. Neff]